MPVFVRQGTWGSVGATRELCSPWRRWFAWYPVTDMSVTYWLCWVEWRRVVPDGSVLPNFPFRVPPRIEYRLTEFRKMSRMVDKPPKTFAEASAQYDEHETGSMVLLVIVLLSLWVPPLFIMARLIADAI